ncbi:MAG: hypothetical protein PSV36_05470 [Algoriphagus sp.]|nr:hypothetical protein [Algoriphagus sp.]
MKKLSTLFLLLFFIGFTAVFAQEKINVKGTWTMSVTSDMGSGSPTFVLDQVNDTTITGTYTGQLGESAVKGTLKGNVIHLEFDIQGNLIEYDGTVKGAEMSGKVKLASMGEGTFSGKRK